MSSDSEDFSSDSSSNAGESLGGQTVKMFKKSVFDKQEFLPEGCINTLITKCAVIKELALTQEEMKKESNIKLLNFILEEGARKIFAITLCAGLGGQDLRKAMTQFRKKNFGDASLPITEETRHKVPFFGNEDTPPKSPWDTVKTRLFCNQQWAFLAPVFSNESLNLRLHADDILPFTCKDDDVKSGAFGEVHQVTVHPSHQKNPVLTVRLFCGFLLSAHQCSLI
jgi:hypothetical protein